MNSTLKLSCYRSAHRTAPETPKTRILSQAARCDSLRSSIPMQSKPKVVSRPVNHRRHQECAARSISVSFGCGPSFLRASDARHPPHRRSCCVFVRPRDAGRDWNSRVREEGTKDAASRAASANRSNSKHHKDERDSSGSKRLRTGSDAVGTAASDVFVRAVSSSPQTQLVTLPGLNTPRADVRDALLWICINSANYYVRPGQTRMRLRRARPRGTRA